MVEKSKESQERKSQESKVRDGVHRVEECASVMQAAFPISFATAIRRNRRARASLSSPGLDALGELLAEGGGRRSESAERLEADREEYGSPGERSVHQYLISILCSSVFVWHRHSIFVVRI